MTQQALVTRRYVYAIEAIGTGLVKIGRAWNPAERLRQLQTGSPVPLQLIAVTPETEDFTEAAIHERFRPWRAHGEWFALEPEDIAAEVIGFGRTVGAAA